jgi:hypothetical protein
MIFTSENNWHSWQYGNHLPFGNRTDSSSFKINLGLATEPIGNFGNELKKAAQSTIDYYPGLKPSILFSGGLDSELVLRSYLDIGIIPNIYIARYENDINIVDVSYAVAICSLLNVKYNIIEINLKKFYENDAERISEISQIDFPRALPQLLVLKKIEEGFPVLAASEPSWQRTHSNYSLAGKWVQIFNEYDVGWSKYVRYLDRPAIGEWFKWTPGIMISYTKLNWFRKLINDEYYGKLGVKSTKIIGYREVYPDILFRKKLTGFESLDLLMDEFELYLEKKYNGLHFRDEVIYTLQEIWEYITGEKISAPPHLSLFSDYKTLRTI